MPYTTADLLSRTRDIIRRPAIDVEVTDAKLYRYLSEAQEYYMRQLEIHVPAIASVSITITPDSYGVLDLGGLPLGRVRLFDDIRRRVEYSPEYRREGTLLRPYFGWGRATPLYAVYTPRPPALDAVTEPEMEPEFARAVLPYHAAVLWATEGGLHDPTPYQNQEQKKWSGDPAYLGDVGILGSVVDAYSAPYRGTDRWWDSPDLSNLPIDTR